MLLKKDTSIATLALLLALTTTPRQLTTFFKINPVLAQSPTTNEVAQLNTNETTSEDTNSSEPITSSDTNSKATPLLWLLIPLALVGLFIGWLLKNRDAGESETAEADDSEQTTSNIVENLSQKASDAVQSTTDTASNIVGNVTETASNFTEDISQKTSDAVQNTTDTASDLIEDITEDED